MGGAGEVVGADVIEEVELRGDPEEGMLPDGTKQGHADEIRDVIPEHWETKGGSPVVSVCNAVVYVAQKGVISAVD